MSIENNLVGGVAVVTDADLIERSRALTSVDLARRSQVEGMAKKAGVVLEEYRSGSVDPHVALYVFLRNDTSKDTTKFKHLLDQNLFAEVLRILGEDEQLEKFKSALPNIFN